MKASEIRKLSAAEMDAKLAELKKELFNLRFQQAVNQLDNPMRISAVKKDTNRAKANADSTVIIKDSNVEETPTIIVLMNSLPKLAVVNASA